MAADDPTPQELARGFADAYNAGSMGLFCSWTDADLYRAIDSEPPGGGYEQAVNEYVEELRARRGARKRQEQLEDRLRDRYQI